MLPNNLWPTTQHHIQSFSTIKTLLLQKILMPSTYRDPSYIFNQLLLLDIGLICDVVENHLINIASKMLLFLFYHNIYLLVTLRA